MLNGELMGVWAYGGRMGSGHANYLKRLADPKGFESSTSAFGVGSFIVVLDLIVL